MIIFGEIKETSGISRTLLESIRGFETLFEANKGSEIFKDTKGFFANTLLTIPRVFRGFGDAKSSFETLFRLTGKL